MTPLSKQHARHGKSSHRRQTRYDPSACAIGRMWVGASSRWYKWTRSSSHSCDIYPKDSLSKADGPWRRNTFFLSTPRFLQRPVCLKLGIGSLQQVGFPSIQPSCPGFLEHVVSAHPVLIRMCFRIEAYGPSLHDLGSALVTHHSADGNIPILERPIFVLFATGAGSCQFRHLDILAAGVEGGHPF